MWPPPGSYIKASPLMQPVAASPKGDLNTGVLLYHYQLPLNYLLDLIGLNMTHGFIQANMGFSRPLWILLGHCGSDNYGLCFTRHIA